MTHSLFNLTGKTALVTGSSRGLGNAIAKGLGAAGASLILNGVNETRLSEAVKELRADGADASGVAFDIADETAVRAAFERFDADGISIDILVNNAGIQYRKPLLELETADWQRVLDVNLTSAFVIGREAARRMAVSDGGKIVNIASVLSALARPTVAPYAVSKAGLKMLTQSMAAEWGEKNIQVNAIGPGYMITDMNEALIANPDFDAWVKGRTPSRRWGRPEELVGVAVFLASAASDYVSGQIIYADGGMTSVL
ncbi:SDR family oxidoreductase [Roseibium sp. M-1]